MEMLSKECMLEMYPQIKQVSFEQASNIFASYFTMKSNRELNNIVYNELGFECQKKDVRSVINYVTTRMYPNEAVIKSAFIKNVLFKLKNQVTIFELNTNACRVDLCKINGESVAYEIKTDLDNLKRLNKQLTEYLYVFEKVFVICSENKVADIEHIIPKCVGIYTYKLTRYGNYSFSKKRDAHISTSIDCNKQLTMLTLQEKKIFKIDATSSTEIINKNFKTALKYRYSNKWNFLNEHKEEIYDIDYQWFFKNLIEPNIIYNY